MTSRPARTADVAVRRRRGNTVYLVRTGAERVYELNDTAFAIWELCDGETAVREMVEAASELFAASPQSLERDVLTALAELRDDGLILDNPLPL